MGAVIDQVVPQLLVGMGPLLVRVVALRPLVPLRRHHLRSIFIFLGT